MAVSLSIFMGQNAGKSITGTADILIGDNAGSLLTNAIEVTAIGVGALGAEVGGPTGITAIGFGAMGAANGANLSTAVGMNALQNDADLFNVAVGGSSGFFKKAGANNVIAGYKAGYGASGTSVYADDVLLGYEAGLTKTTGSQGVAVGSKSQSVAGCAAVSKEVAVGYNTSVTVNGGIALGSGASVSAAGAAAIGQNVSASVPNQILVGLNTQTVAAPNAITVGDQSAVTQTTVSASVSGTAVCSQPFQGGNYAKVVIYVSAINGTATYTFPAAMVNVPVVMAAPSGTVVSSVSNTAISLSGAGESGFIILEGF